MSRLTDFDVELWRNTARCIPIDNHITGIPSRSLEMAMQELIERRAADLSDEDREALEDLRGRITANYDGTHPVRQQAHVAALGKLLAAKEPKR